MWFFFFKQKTAYEMRISDWSSDVCSSDLLDAIVYRMTVEGGGVPATLGYRGFTKSCCTSINHVVCHGIPGDRVLKDGDIVNIDEIGRASCRERVCSPCRSRWSPYT